ncbi:MAG: DNA recombination protein RmuC, partial [Pseudomonadota bacterium]
MLGSLSLLIICIFVSLGALAGSFLTYILLSRRYAHIQEETQHYKIAYHHLEEKTKNDHNLLSEQSQSLNQLRQDNARLHENVVHLKQKSDSLYSEKLEKEQLLDTRQNEFYMTQTELQQQISLLQERNKTLTEQYQHRDADLKKLQAEFSHRFENLANRIFEDKNRVFNEQSQKTLQEALAPVKQSFGDFKTKIDETFLKHHAEQVSLKTEIHNIHKLNQEMSAQTENLTKALKGDSKIQGHWGEMILEKLLEDSGLIKGRDYTLQGEGLRLVNEENSKQQRPDVIINLPEDKHIIIDSKVSLTHYERYIAAEAETEQHLAQKSFLTSVRKHITDLASKAYQDNQKLGTPDFVLMFIPIESAYNFAIQADQSLHDYAWRNRIVLVCTSTLFATLKTVSSIWRLENQNKNAQDIAEQAGRIYDKVYGFLKDMENVGESLNKTQKNYSEAVKKLCDGRGNLISQTEKLRTLGVKTKKNISKDII